MKFDEVAYSELEQRFKEQVERDNKSINPEDLMGIYLPNREPQSPADYILVAMEPSFFGWADNIADAKLKIAKDFRNFEVKPNERTSLLSLFHQSIKRFLCSEGETYHLTDLAKGAMPVVVAALGPQARYKRRYPLLKDELEIVGKPGAPVVAIGKAVHNFLVQQDIQVETGRKLFQVLHYSGQAAGSRKRFPQRYPGRYDQFCSEPFSQGQSLNDLGIKESLKQLVFTYKSQFEAIRSGVAP